MSKPNKNVSLRTRLHQLLMFCVLLFGVTLWPHAFTAAAAEQRIAVVVPFTTSKSQTIFDEIITGLKSKPGIDLVRFDLDESKTAADTHAWLREQNVSAVVAIGRSAHEHVNTAGLGLPIVVGGMGSTPEGASGVSLSGSPDEFFASVKTIAPNIQRVHIVYGEQANGWWIENAKLSAANHGLSLIAHEATTVKSGAKNYKSLLKKAKKSEDAIWIPLVSVVSSRTVLPMVLKKAWDKHLVVFTNSPAHTKQGALFSLYPDNVAMGEQLLELAIEQSTSTNAEPRIELASQMKRAFNWRTASHLGLEYSLDEGAGFDRIYPVQ